MKALAASSRTTQPAKWAALVVGVLLLLNGIVLSIVSNINVGNVVTALFGLLFLAYGFLFEKVNGLPWLHWLVGIGTLVILGFSVFLAAYGQRDNVQFDEDAVVVLGGGVHGERVSSSLARRLDTAIEYHQRNPAALIVVSGGRGSQENISEALAMQRYLVAHEVPANQIVMEDQSTSTIENFKFSDQILQREFPGGYSAAFITNDFHIYRANLIATEVNPNFRHFSATVPWYAVTTNYLREVLVVIQHWIFH